MTAGFAVAFGIVGGFLASPGFDLGEAPCVRPIAARFILTGGGRWLEGLAVAHKPGWPTWIAVSV